MLTALALFQDKVVVVEWWPRGIIAWLLLGLIAGWLAGKLSRGRGFGCITDIILGLIGSVVGASTPRVRARSRAVSPGRR